MDSAIVHSLCCHCGKTFEHYQCKQRKYCSDECYALGRQRRIMRTCATCGKSYETTSKRGLKYCSRECAWQAQIGRERPDLKGRIGWGAGLTKETDERLARMSKAMTKEAPPRELLSDLFVERNLTLGEIGQQFNVTQGTVKRWIDEYELVRKRDMLTPEILGSLTDEGYTHIEIAAMYNCSNSFVGKLAKSYDIDAPHRNKPKDPPRDILAQMYLRDRMTLKQVGDTLGMDAASVQNWLRRYGIQTRTPLDAAHSAEWVPPTDEAVCDLYVNQGMQIQDIGKQTGAGRRYVRLALLRSGVNLRPSSYPMPSSYEADDGHSVRSGLELQVDNWLFAHGLQHEYDVAIGQTRYRTDFLVGDWYIEIWGLIGKPKYDRKHITKLAVYKELALKLLSVYPHDFPALNVLSVLLSK